MSKPPRKDPNVERLRKLVATHVEEAHRAGFLDLLEKLGTKRAAVPGGGNDEVMTPDDLALAIVQHFRPTGSLLDPCAGTGAFVRAFEAYGKIGDVTAFAGTDIKNGDDFLTMEPPKERWGWIITNVPWSKFSAMLEQAMKFADNVVFLDKMNAWGFNGRLRMIEEAGFALSEIARVRQPKRPWPQMGMALAAGHIRRIPAGTRSPGVIISKVDWKP